VVLGLFIRTQELVPTASHRCPLCCDTVVHHCALHHGVLFCGQLIVHAEWCWVLLGSLYCWVCYWELPWHQPVNVIDTLQCPSISHSMLGPQSLWLYGGLFVCDVSSMQSWLAYRIMTGIRTNSFIFFFFPCPILCNFWQCADLTCTIVLTGRGGKHCTATAFTCGRRSGLRKNMHTVCQVMPWHPSTLHFTHSRSH